MKYLEVEVEGAHEQAKRRVMGNGASDERRSKQRDRAERRSERRD